MKILIEQLHGMGDTVCALPKIKQIRDSYPGAYICVIVKLSICKEIIQMSRVRVDEIIIFDVYKSVYNSYKRFLTLRKKNFDIMYSSVLTPIKKAKLFRFFINPKRWIALQSSNKSYASLDDKLHFVDAELLLVDAKNRDITPRLYPRNDDVTRFMLNISQKKYSKIVGVCIGKADISYKYKLIRRGEVYTRAWGSDKFIDLISRLRERNILIILLGGTQEINIAKYFNKFFYGDDGVIDFVGKTSMIESMSLSSICDLQIGVDTGMQHVASAVGTTTLSIFGPTNPLTHGAYGSNSFFVTYSPKLDCQFCFGTRKYLLCKRRSCLDNISVDMVYDRVVSILGI